MASDEENRNDPRLVGLASQLQAICIERGLTLATAESCTGGLVAHILTEVSGSSAYLKGGVISYSDEVKAVLLGVPREALAAHGAVSAQVARAMAIGARARLDVDVALAVTGIAGPTGGTEAKPVGLTYVAVAAGGDVAVRRCQWGGDRSSNKRSSAEAVLELALEHLGSGSRGAASARNDGDARSADEASAAGGKTGRRPSGSEPEEGRTA